MTSTSTTTTPTLLTIEQDISLFNKYFPDKFDWKQIKWEFTDEPNRAYYAFRENKIVLSPKAIEIDYVRFHEMGHVIHHLLFNWKRFHFKTDYLDIACNLYWGVPECKRNYVESFADAFSDTMLRLKNPNCAMFDHNKKIIKLLGGVKYAE